MSPHRKPFRNQGEVTPTQAIQQLKEGNRRYIDSAVNVAFHTAGHVSMVDEHAPVAAILACADARVGAELIFDQKPGALFMVRLAGNFVSDYGLASMEYAVDVLGVPLLMVLGHTHCGAVAAAVNVVENDLDVPGRIFVLIDGLEPSVLRAREANPDDVINGTTQENVRRQVHRLRTISPLIAEAIEAGNTEVVGAIFDMASGEVIFLDC